MVWHGKKLTKAKTGGRTKKNRDKKLARAGRYFTATKIGEEEKERIRGRGRREKIALRYTTYANVMMPDKSIKRAKIARVLESAANRHFARMGIVTKGTIIETEFGKARVTSRPGQHGIVNAILIEK